jgi:3-oxoacyl-[acyl-carrier protein] reductase
MREAAIISGGTKGLGRALSLAFGEAGFEVIALYKSDITAADALAAELSRRGIAGRVIAYDVSASDPQKLPIPAVEHLVLINNAWAPFEPKPLHLVRWPEVQEAVEVGVKGALALAQAVLPAMVRQKRGSIVNVLSAAAEGTPPKGFGAYAIAKGAMRGLTQALAAEYRARGVRVFAVSPGFMRTALTEAWDARLREAIAASMARVLEPDEVARAILEKVRDPALEGRGESYPIV